MSKDKDLELLQSQIQAAVVNYFMQKYGDKAMESGLNFTAEKIESIGKAASKFSIQLGKSIMSIFSDKPKEKSVRRKKISKVSS